jgi:hypothetical protein
MRLNAAQELRISFLKTMGLMTARLMIEIRAQLAAPPNRAPAQAEIKYTIFN